MRTVSSLFVAALLVLAVTTSLANKKPVIAIEFCRHGDRTPLNFVFENAALNNYTVPYGQLTPNGMRQHFLVGSELKSRYIDELHFLNPTFSNTDVYIRSSDVNRTLESATSQLYGLYPAGTGPQVHNAESLDIAVPPMKLSAGGLRAKAEVGMDAIHGALSPMPINTIPFNKDFLLAAWGGACDKYNENYTKSVHSARTAEYFNKNVKEVADKLNELLGVNLSATNDNEVWTVFGQLTCGYYNGNPLPEGISTEYLFESVIPPLAHLLYYEYSYGNYENALLASSEMLSEIKSRILAAVNNEPSPKFMLYSGHDLTLAALLTVFKLPEQFPTFASTIFFELYEKDNTSFLSDDLSNYYVTMTFNSEPMLIPGCDGIECDLNNFFNVIDALIIPDVPKACQSETAQANFVVPYDF